MTLGLFGRIVKRLSHYMFWRLFKPIMLGIAILVVIAVLVIVNGCRDLLPAVSETGKQSSTTEEERRTEGNPSSQEETNEENTDDQVIGDVKITVLDVGQGSCAIIESAGEVAVIDTGDSAHAQVPVAYLKRLNPSSVKYLFNTHWDADHCGAAVGILKNFYVENVFGAAYEADTRTYRSLMEHIRANNIPYSTPSVGTVFRLGYASIIVIGPLKEYEEENSKSLVFLVSNGVSTVFIGGDCTVESETDIVLAGLVRDLAVYVVNHHGSNSSSCELFLNTIRPEYSIVSCSATSGYGHPTKKVLGRISAVGSLLYRTDVQGDIVFCLTDGGIVFEKDPTTDWTPGVYDPSVF